MYDWLIHVDWDTGGFYGSGDDPVRRNLGDYTRLLRLHRAHAARIAASYPGVRPIGPLLMPRLTDARTMRVACNELHLHGGDAAGPNGLHLADLGNAEIWSMCRALRDTISDNTYRPGRDRKHAISKGPGRGNRILTIQNIEDRVVGKAAALILQPVVDPAFSTCCVGFRPGRGPHEAVAKALTLAAHEERWVWCTADIKDAFDAVPHARFLDACRQHFPPDMVAFIDVISNTGRKHGLRQGSPASPLFFNIFADHFIDKHWPENAGRLLRYADDLLALCPSEEEAQADSTKLTYLTRVAGTPLKANPSVVHIRAGEPITWLGYQFQHEGSKLRIGIAPKAWGRLHDRLSAAHLAPGAPLHAVEIIRGWLEYLGPCYVHEDRRNVIRQIRDIAAALAFDEIPTRRQLDDYWQRAYARWRRIYPG